LVQPDNEQALGDAIRWAWEHQPQALQIGVAAREFARQHCDVGQMVKQYERVYAHLVNQ